MGKDGRSGGPFQRACLMGALLAVFAMGGTALGVSASTPSPPPAPSTGGGGTYLAPQDGTPASVFASGRRSAGAFMPAGAAPHHRGRSVSSGKGARARVVDVSPKALSKSPTKAATATTAAGPPPGFGTTNSITRDDQFNFNGLDVAPPDTQIAAGQSYSVEVVNDMGSIAPRNGGTQSFFDLNSFFFGNTFLNFIVTDPRIVYDQAARRWYMSITSFDAQNDSMMFLAVSQNADPIYWWVYRVFDNRTSHDFCDQPHLGYSTDNIVVTCDFFSPTAFVDEDFAVISKSNAMAGHLYVYIWSFANYAGISWAQSHMSLQPAQSMSASNATYISNHPAVDYLVYDDGTGVGVLAVFGNPVTRSVGWMDAFGKMPAQRSVPSAQQPGGTFLDAGDLRYFGAVFSNNRIWATSADSCTPTGDTRAHACMRISQADITNWPNPTLTLSYDIATVGADLIYPALTLDSSGTAYVAYTSTSLNSVPEFDIADILPAAPGQVDQAFQVVAGGAAYVGPTLGTGGPLRWGDYSGAAPDPNYVHGVILAGEYTTPGNQNNWATLGGSFRVPPCNSVSVNSSMGMPSYPGPTVTYTGNAVGCWGNPQYRFWKRPPNGGWVIAQDFSSNPGFVWDTSKETVLGFYDFELDARSQGFIAPYDTLTSFFYYLASPPRCSDNVTVGPASPAATGGAVQVSATTDCPDPVYRFWVKPPGGAWSVAQPFGASSTFNWSATGAPGTYSIEVDVKDRLDPASTYGFPAITTYTLVGCSGASLTASPAQPAPSGAAVTLTGAATCLGTPEYRFWVKPPGGGWSSPLGYQSTSTFNWQTAGLAQGTYSLEVDVRNRNSTSGYETVANSTYTLSTSPCAPGISASPGSPGATGSGATFTASVQTPASCPNPRFRFWLQGPAGAWSLAQDYGAANTFVWSGAGLPGSYHVEVDARDAGESVAYDATATVGYRLNGCAGAGISAIQPNGQPPGTAIDVTGTATCIGTPNYRFWVRSPGGAWQMKQDYSNSATYHWVSPSIAGTYGLEVDVRNANATSGYEVVANMTFVLGVIPCTTPTLTANNPSPQSSGSSIQLTASTTGCPNPIYRYWRKAPGGAWYTGGWVTLNTYNDCCFNDGTAMFEVDVKDASETNVAYDGVAIISFDFLPCMHATLTAAPLQAPQGPVINLTGAAFCWNDINPQFRFWYKTGANGRWILLVDYGQGVNNAMWEIAGHAPGLYYFEVDVRDQGTNVSYQTTKVIAYRL